MSSEPLPLTAADLERAVREERRRNADFLDARAKALSAHAIELDEAHLDALALKLRGQAEVLLAAAMAIRDGAPSLGGRGP